MKCNTCWRTLSSGETALVSTCSHIFCSDCAKTNWSGRSSTTCPVCDTPLTPRNIVSTTLCPSADKVILLCGLDPSDLMNVLTKAMRFYQYQTEICAERSEAEISAVGARVATCQREYEERLQEVQTRLGAARRQGEAAAKENEEHKAELAELQGKYATLVQQKRKLEQMYSSIKQQQQQYVPAAQALREPAQVQVPAQAKQHQPRTPPTPTKIDLLASVTGKGSRPPTGDKLSLLRVASRPPSSAGQGSSGALCGGSLFGGMTIGTPRIRPLTRDLFGAGELR